MVETNKPNQVGVVQLPPQFFEYVNKWKTPRATGGTKTFLQTLVEQEKNAEDEVLNILELVWIKGRGDSSVANKYETSPDSIYRIKKSLEPFKEVICEFLTKTERVKRWYIQELDQSDYETIQQYIQRARRDGLKRYKENIQVSRHVWIFLNHKNPDSWTADDVISYLNTKSQGAQSRILDAIRQVAPQIRETTSNESIKTGRFREKLMRRRKDIFGQDVKMIKDALVEYDHDIASKWMLHITLGAREGSTDVESGMCGVGFDRFKGDFSRVDLYESKVRGGIWWRDCPVDLFFPHLPDLIREMWKKRGKPTSERIFKGGYKEIAEMYKTIRAVLTEKFKGKVEPSLLKEFASMRPHDSDKIHVNLLWEAGIPLEIVGGQDLGGSEGVGLVGRGWLDVNVIKKYYLSMTARSERFKEVRDKVTAYSKRFNGDRVE
jgi:hypothetical protein